MNVKVHITGQAFAYPEQRRRPKTDDRPPVPGRPQGSLYSQQKRKIADAVEYMRRAGKHKPLIFVLTCPGFIERSCESGFLTRFVNNLRQNYGLVDYVWVREFTGNGFPHFHFVADMPTPPGDLMVRLSLLWSSYFGSSARNSVRFGTRPTPYHRRKLHITGPRMAFYMSKYIGKSLSDDEKQRIEKAGVTLRSFQVSQNAAKWSAPIVYEESLKELLSGLHYRCWEAEIETPTGEVLYAQTDPTKYRWRRCGNHAVFSGIPTSWRTKNLKISEN